ncbi:MAG: EAL domain-containing protein, partial [Burkholderiales bacterium]
LPPQWKRSLGYEEHEVENTVAGWTALLHPDDREPIVRAVRDHYERRIPYDMEYRSRTKAGDYRWFHTKGQAMWDESGKATYMAGTVVDVTERKLAELHIKNLNRIYAVLSRINALIVRVRDREELFREACRVAIEAGQFRMAWIGLVDRDAMLVKPVAWDGDVRDFFDSAPLTVMETRPGGHGLAGRAVREKKAVISNDIQSDPQRMMKKEMSERGINSVAVVPLFVDDDVVGILALYAEDKDFFSDEEMKLLKELAGDISFALDHIERAERLDYFAYYDALTALANRTLFNERLTQRLKIAGQEQGRLALVLLDVDRFKAVNDSLGRQAGDELLKQIAKRLVRFVGDSSRVGRLSADHYAVMLPAVRHEDEVARFVDEQSRSCFGEPFRLGRETDLRISVKAGVALSPEDGSDAETLQRNAEAALEKAKASGENFLFYAPHMTERVAEKLALENKLRLALERDEFVLHYQPKVDVETRRIEGVEALIRWQSPELGLVPPLRFIPLMEETGMILEVGAWAMRRAALDHHHWLGQGAAAPRIAVNVSSIQLRKRDFVQTVQAALAEGAEPAGIDLEITESLIMEDIEENIEKLAAVRDMGVRIAVDDFGTGYSSLRYLAKLPVHTVKIDRSFIITMLEDANAMTVVSTIISLVHSLRLKVVAEGVESEEQAKILHLLKCDEMQGYLISRPVPQEELLALLGSGKFAAPRAPR